MKYLLALLTLGAVLTGCVPKNQYQALETERNYYRNQTVLSDSMDDLRAIQSYDEVDVGGSNELSQRIRQVEGLTATNIALNNSYQSLQSRYEELLTQSQSLLSESGNQVTGLQQNLAERTASVAQREAELRQLEMDLQAREQSIARIEGDYIPAGGSEPAAYGTVTAGGGRPPLSAGQNAALTLNNIQSDLNQLLANNLTGNTYVVAPAGINRLQVSLAEATLSDDGFTVSPSGQNLLRRIASMLRNYPGAEYIVTGHASGNSDGNTLRAYEDSTDKAINVAQQLVNFGLDPSKITAGGKGFYAPIGSNATPEGQAANRRMDIFIVIPE